MSKPCHSGTETAESYAGAVSFFAGMIGKAVGGANPGVAIANALTGQGTWVTRTADLFDKIHNGTAEPTDYAEVAASTMSLLAGLGVLAGLANPWTLTAAVANGALFTYNFFLKESPLCEKGAHDFNNINRNGKAHGYDPLILNLDGNGIQTIAPSSISARFDHNADGIATATGWTAAGNGILALDLDKNGKIDSGKEIFGNHSVLSNGATAAHSYAALAELDSNHDNLINQADELFSSLKVWQDINQDGISQSNELFTLQALGIQSLNLEHQENSKDLGNGNRLTHIGSYTKTDGTTGEMGDVEFASNSLYSRYTDTVELTPEQLKAPNLQGLGRLRDLRSITLN